MKIAIVFTVIFSGVICFTSLAQIAETSSYFRTVENGDTIMGMTLPEITVRTSNKEFRIKYEKTKKLVLKNISLANYILELSNSLDNNVISLNKKKDKRKFLKSEKEKLFNSFTEIVKDMSISEGKVFNKLVYRQTGQTTYNIIQKYLGKPKAFMWQTISRLGGANLKTEYDPVYEDILIEDIMSKIESGKLKSPRLPHSVQEYNFPVYE